MKQVPEPSHYTPEQVKTLEILRNRLGEKGFVVFSLKRSKYPLEFIAVEVGQFHSSSSAAVVRLCGRWGRKRVRIQFLYFKKTWSNDLRDYVTMGIERELYFAHQTFFPTRYNISQSWIPFVHPFA